MRPQSSPGPAIAAELLVKRYPGDVTALDGISFSVEPGTVFGLLGPNGAGKSTTVKILTTLARPDGGRASVAGIDVVRDPVRVRRTIGAVGQRAAVDPEATGRENLVLEARIHGLGGAPMRSRVDELLERFGLTESAGRMARTYSGGHAPQARRGDGPRPSTDGPLPRRADHRARPGGTSRPVGRDRSTDPGRRPDHPPDHPLPGGSRPTGRPAGHRRPRPDRRERQPRRAEGRAAGRRHPGRAPRAGRGGARRRVPYRHRRAPGARRRRPLAARPGDPRRDARPGCAVGARRRPGSRSPRSRSRVRRSTTSTSAIPGGPIASRPRSPSHDRRRSIRLHDPAPRPGPRAPAVVPGDHPHPADHLAAPVRSALPERDRHPRLRGRVAHTSTTSCRESSS